LPNAFNLSPQAFLNSSLFYSLAVVYSLHTTNRMLQTRIHNVLNLLTVVLLVVVIIIPANGGGV